MQKLFNKSSYQVCKTGAKVCMELKGRDLSFCFALTCAPMLYTSTRPKCKYFKSVYVEHKIYSK